MRWSRSACWNEAAMSTRTPPLRGCSSTAPGRRTSAGCWRWRTPNCIPRGACSPTRCARGSRRAEPSLARTSWPCTRIAVKFPWDRYRTVIDVGAAEGCVPVQLALRHPLLTGGGFDLPDAGWVFEEYVACHGLADRLQFYPGDFFTDPLPPADVLIMGHILHDWSLEERLALLRKAYRALPDGGAIIDYDRRANAFGLLMSVNMLIETQAGFDYTAADCRSWLTGIGFRDSYVEPLAGPDSMVVGIK